MSCILELRLVPVAHLLPVWRFHVTLPLYVLWKFFVAKFSATISSSYFIFGVKHDHDECMWDLVSYLLHTYFLLNDSALHFPHIFTMEIFCWNILGNYRQQPLYIWCETWPWWVAMWHWVLYLSHSYILINDSVFWEGGRGILSEFCSQYF